MKALYPGALGTPQLAAFANSLAGLGAQHAPDLKVETCGDWCMSDLLWHLTEVQLFWAYIIANRPEGPESYQHPDRPTDADLPDSLRAAAAKLSAALGSADASDNAWSWSDDHTVGFSIRRQTHEAFIHYIDGVIAAAEPLPQIVSELAADGIDELVAVMLGGLPDWATFAPGDRTLRLVSADTGDSWTLRIGRATGMAPGSSASIDQLAAMPVSEPSTEADCAITAKAADLCLWLWGRAGIELLRITGDAALGSQLRAIIASETQ